MRWVYVLPIYDNEGHLLKTIPLRPRPVVLVANGIPFDLQNDEEFRIKVDHKCRNCQI